MKQVIFFIVILILTGVGLYFGRDYIPQITSAQGRLNVKTIPSSAVLINGESKGESPISIYMRPDTYELRIEPQDSSAFASWQQAVTVRKGVETYITVTLGPTESASSWQIVTLEKINGTTELSISSEANDSEIIINGERKGTTPLSFQDLPAGMHDVRLAGMDTTGTVSKIKLTKGYKVHLAVHPVTSGNASQEATESATLSTDSASESKSKQVLVKILTTPTGWLRVRSEPSTSGSELAKVDPDEEFPLVDEQTNWYKIEYEDGKEGWISSQYAEKIE